MWQAFSLIPFPAGDIPEVTINGMVDRQSNNLNVRYLLAGNLSAIFLPSPSTNPARKDDLWQTTCFEFFIAGKNSPRYWEINLSPSGDWNVYVMDAYRQVNMRKESRIEQLSAGSRRTMKVFRLKQNWI